MLVPDDPTPNELSRRIDVLAAAIDRLTTKIDLLPTAELLAAREGRIMDRFTDVQVSGDRRDTAIDRLTAALEAERTARHDADDKEAEDRTRAIAFEKARVGTWFRWLVGGVVAAWGMAVSQAFRLHG